MPNWVEFQSLAIAEVLLTVAWAVTAVAIGVGIATRYGKGWGWFGGILLAGALLLLLSPAMDLVNDRMCEMHPDDDDCP